MSLDSLFIKKNRIVNEAERIVCLKIQRYCKRYKRTVKTVYGVTILDKNGNKAVSEKRSLPEKWIFDFEDRFGPFGFYVCKNGEWITGQTPLIIFNKPKL